MVYVLAWRTEFPGYENSNPKCRRIITIAGTDNFTETERTKFQVVNLPNASVSDFTNNMALDADDLEGGIILLDPRDYPAEEIS